MWYFMLHSGIHATVTGVLLAFVIPFGDGSKIYIISITKFFYKP
jgi:NhaA family Na+:H+ antiporter